MSEQAEIDGRRAGRDSGSRKRGLLGCNLEAPITREGAYPGELLEAPREAGSWGPPGHVRVGAIVKRGSKAAAKTEGGESGQKSERDSRTGSRTCCANAIP